MNTVKVLIKGYVKFHKNSTCEATSSTTLIKAGKLNIVVDPGCDRKLLLSVLKENKIKTSDMDLVFISHYHPDHCTLMGIFENATIVDSVQWQKGSLSGDLKDEYLPGTDIKILKTPGHSPEHAALLVKTDLGIVTVGADVFWWSENEVQNVDIDKYDDFASDHKLLKKSREMILKISDYIIPGHGEMFRVPK